MVVGFGAALGSICNCHAGFAGCRNSDSQKMTNEKLAYLFLKYPDSYIKQTQEGIFKGVNIVYNPRDYFDYLKAYIGKYKDEFYIALYFPNNAPISWGEFKLDLFGTKEKSFKTFDEALQYIIDEDTKSNERIAPDKERL